jgi:hypothetical protein
MKFDHWRALVGASLLALTAQTSRAQTQPGQTSPAPPAAQRENTMTRLERESVERAESEREREFALRMVDETRARPERRRDPRPTFALVRDDYVRLQVVNNNLAAAASGTLDPKFVADSAAEIRKRAERLKANLALPAVAREEGRAGPAPKGEPAQLKSELAALDALILGFVRNPIFRDARVADARQVSRASRELDDIIEISGRVRKAGEQLAKGAQKSR